MKAMEVFSLLQDLKNPFFTWGRNTPSGHPGNTLPKSYPSIILLTAPWWSPFLPAICWPRIWYVSVLFLFLWNKLLHYSNEDPVLLSLLFELLGSSRIFSWQAAGPFRIVLTQNHFMQKPKTVNWLDLVVHFTGLFCLCTLSKFSLQYTIEKIDLDCSLSQQYDS